jgi:hypothetical protein
MTKQITIIIVVALIFFGLGLAASSLELIKSSYLGQLLTKTDQEDTFQAGWQAANQRLVESGWTPDETIEIGDMNGQVKEIKDNQISLEIYPFDLLADPDLDIRIVEVDENTKIYQLVAENQEQVTFPGMHTIKKGVSLSDIQIGQSIKVVAQENIRNAKQFKAIEVDILSASFDSSQ